MLNRGKVGCEINDWAENNQFSFLCGMLTHQAVRPQSVPNLSEFNELSQNERVDYMILSSPSGSKIQILLILLCSCM